jgi:hypothetical protein
LKLLEPQYTATITVAPADLDLTSSGQLAGELQLFAALPSHDQGQAKLDRYAQLFGSTALAERLLAEHLELLPVVFADEWDAERQTWHPQPGLSASLERTVLGFFRYPTLSQPDAGRLAEWLGEHIVVSRRRSPLLQLRMTDPRRAFAVSLLDMVHSTADQLLREAALNQIGSQIEQLEAELAKTTAPTRAQALEAMVAEQYRTRALFEADQPYAAQVVVPAMANPTPTSFDPIVMLVLAASTGAILGLAIIFVRDALRSRLPGRRAEAPVVARRA